MHIKMYGIDTYNVYPLLYINYNGILKGPSWRVGKRVFPEKNRGTVTKRRVNDVHYNILISGMYIHMIHSRS